MEDGGRRLGEGGEMLEDGGMEVWMRKTVKGEELKKKKVIRIKEGRGGKGEKCDKEKGNTEKGEKGNGGN